MRTPTTTKGPGALRLLRLPRLARMTALFAEAVTHARSELRLARFDASPEVRASRLASARNAARLSREYYQLMTQEGLSA